MYVHVQNCAIINDIIFKNCHAKQIIITIKQSLRRSLTMKMKTKISAISFILLLHIDISFGQFGGLSAKLDFGDTETTTNNPKKIVETIVKVRQSSPQTRKLVDSTDNLFNIRKISVAAAEAVENLKNDFKVLSLICANGVCNTSDVVKKANLKTNNDDSKADVIVKVITGKGDTTENKTKIDIAGSSGDVDVPVIVGTDTKTIQNRIDRKPNFIPYTINRNLNNNYQPKVHYPMPHFNPNYNNHYFGENPPSMYVWYKQKNNLHNPQAFVSHSRPYYFSDNWRRSTLSNVESKMAAPVICTCANQPSSWYPIIDDKMEHV